MKKHKQFFKQNIDYGLLMPVFFFDFNWLGCHLYLNS